MKWLAGLIALITCLSFGATQNQEPPISFYQYLNSLPISSAEDFIRLVVRKDPNEEDDSGMFDLNGLPNQRAVDNSKNTAVSSDRCDPKMMSVPFPTDPDPSAITYPRCTHLYRCGGCCSHPSLKCAPIASDIVVLSQIKTRYIAGQTLTRGFHEVRHNMVNHTACTCQCAARPADCNVKQQYIPQECKCKCRNEDTEMPKCNQHQRWDEKECQCLCMRVQNCENGMYYNTHTCRCEIPQGAREANNGNSLVSGGTNTGGQNTAVSADPCATHNCPPSYRKQRVGDRCRCEFSFLDGFGRR